MRDYPFTILDVAGILNLKVRRRQPTNMDVDCPFCGHKKGKMNLNFAQECIPLQLLRRKRWNDRALQQGLSDQQCTGICRNL